MLTLSQLAAPASGAIENWLLCAAAIASMTLLAKKLFFRTPGQAEFVTQSDLHREMTSVRDKIDARFFVLTEKMEQAKADLLTAAQHRAAASDRRLATIESTLARLDERSKK